jgi:hypothetical protein
MVSRNRNLDKRANWFDRQFIRAQDFVDADDYVLDRHRRHVRTMHTSGVAEGLLVSGDIGAKSVMVEAGTAVDALGREIVALMSLPAVTLPTGVTDAEIYLVYEEAFDDPSTDPGVSGFTRIREVPSLAVRRLGEDADPVPASSGDHPVPGILLAAVRLRDGALTAVPDNSVRSAAGTVMGVSAFDKVLLRVPGHVGGTHPGISAAPDTGDILFSSGTSAELMRIAATGHVGIGTSGPLTGALTVEDPVAQLVLRHSDAEANGGVWRVTMQDSALRFEANTAGAGDFSTSKTLLAMSASEDTVTLGSNGNVALRTRHVNGKDAGNDSADTLFLNWDNGKHVEVGSDGHETLLRTYGEVNARNFPGDDKTPALASLSLSSRGQGGRDFTWRTFTASVGGAATGVTANAYEIWQYEGGSGVARLSIHPDGETHVGLNGGRLYVQNAPVTASDVRLKSDITTVTEAMDRLAGLRGVSYLRRRPDGGTGTDDRRHLGVVAQEVEGTCPELVFVSGRDGHLAVDYQGITAVLIEAVKELAAEVDSLSVRISEGRDT